MKRLIEWFERFLYWVSDFDDSCPLVARPLFLLAGIALCPCAVLVVILIALAPTQPTWCDFSVARKLAQRVLTRRRAPDDAKLLALLPDSRWRLAHGAVLVSRLLTTPDSSGGDDARDLEVGYRIVYGWRTPNGKLRLEVKDQDLDAERPAVETHVIVAYKPWSRKYFIF